MTRASRVGRTLVVAALLTLMGGCTSDPSDDTQNPAPTKTSNYMDNEAFSAEYLAAQKNFTLPPGWAWPPPVTLTAVPDGEGVPREHRFERGAGLQLAESYWICIWDQEWLAQRNADKTRAETALVTLRDGIKKTTFYAVWGDDSVRALLDRVQSSAELGDAGPMKEYVTNNCDGTKS